MKNRAALLAVALGSALGGAAIAVAVVSASSEAPAAVASTSAVAPALGGGGDPEPQPASAGSTPPATARALDENADAYAFLRDLTEARDGDPAALARRYAGVRSRWTGARVRWEVLVIDSLCRRADACFVHGYDRARTGDSAPQGFMPQVVLDSAEHARLLAGCAAHQPCVATIEATMRDVVVREDRPTRLTLVEARVRGTRAVAPAERWFGQRNGAQ